MILTRSKCKCLPEGEAVAPAIVVAEQMAAAMAMMVDDAKAAAW
jgi:hypothetical protein